MGGVVCGGEIEVKRAIEVEKAVGGVKNWREEGLEARLQERGSGGVEVRGKHGGIITYNIM